jgi:predicted dehydrogenase
VQAGKDVYVEKPCSHNVFEGRKMIEAARKYDKIVQIGFQNRSIDNVRKAMQFLHSGGIGEVYMARGMCYKPRDSFGISPNTDPPKELHYDLWLGPAGWRSYNEMKGHYNWHWHWDTGNGDIGNQGPHQFDVARWGLGKNEHPVKVSSHGGYYKYTKDQCSQETANTQTATLEYADGKVLQFEVRGIYTMGEGTMDVRIGNLFYGTDGWMEIDGGKWKTYMGRDNEPGPSSESEEEGVDLGYLAAPGGGGHYQNFIAAVRSRKVDDLTCDIQEGYYSTVLPLISNISYRLGRSLQFDGKTEKFVNDKEADKMLTREYRKPYIVDNAV